MGNGGKRGLKSLGILGIALTISLGLSGPSVHADSNLTNLVSSYLSSQPGRYSVTAIELGGQQREVHIRDSTQVDPASIFKLYYAALAFEKIQQGKWTFRTKLPSNYSVQTCLRLMISYSDNYCATDFRGKLGISHINSRINQWGLLSSHIVATSRGEYITKHTTTADVARFLKQLHSGNLLNAGNTANFITLLKGQVWRGRASSGIQSGVPVASKSGQLLVNNGMIEADSAIIFGPGSTYIFVVIGSGGATGLAVRGASKLVYENWQAPISNRATYGRSQLVVSAKTYLRTRPGGPVIKTLPIGSAIELEWSQRGWLYVQSGTRKGFIYENTVRLSNGYLRWGGL
jgi:beta-lactamase class A